MKRSEIAMGGCYAAKVSDRLVTVRVDRVRLNGLAKTVWDVTNLNTGRQLTFRSAARFRREVKDAFGSKTQIPVG